MTLIPKKWQLKFAQEFVEKNHKLDIMTQKRIYQFLTVKVLNHPNPEKLAKPLKGNFKGLHRFRIGDYRVLVKINKGILLIIAVDLDHRKNIYR